MKEWRRGGEEERREKKVKTETERETPAEDLKSRKKAPKAE